MSVLASDAIAIPFLPVFEKNSKKLSAKVKQLLSRLGQKCKKQETAQ